MSGCMVCGSTEGLQRYSICLNAESSPEAGAPLALQPVLCSDHGSALVFRFGMVIGSLRRQRVELVLEESDRQMVLLALAHLSVARTGWHDALHTLALQIDNQNDGRALMFDEFRATCRTEVVELKQRIESRQNALMVLVGQRDGTTPWNDHKARHVLLHAMLDELVADWLTQTGKRSSSSTVLELMNWANEQRSAPTEPGQ